MRGVTLVAYVRYSTAAARSGHIATTCLQRWNPRSPDSLNRGRFQRRRQQTEGSAHHPVPPERILVPPELRRAVLFWGHCSGQRGHRRAKGTSRVVSAAYWWPTLYRDVRAYVRACVACHCSRVVDKVPPARLGGQVPKSPVDWWVPPQLVPAERRELARFPAEGDRQVKEEMPPDTLEPMEVSSVLATSFLSPHGETALEAISRTLQVELGIGDSVSCPSPLLDDRESYSDRGSLESLSGSGTFSEAHGPVPLGNTLLPEPVEDVVQDVRDTLSGSRSLESLPQSLNAYGPHCSSVFGCLWCGKGDHDMGLCPVRSPGTLLPEPWEEAVIGVQDRVPTHEEGAQGSPSHGSEVELDSNDLEGLLSPELDDRELSEGEVPPNTSPSPCTEVGVFNPLDICDPRVKAALARFLNQAGHPSPPVGDKEVPIEEKSLDPAPSMSGSPACHHNQPSSRLGSGEGLPASRCPSEPSETLPLVCLGRVLLGDEDPRSQTTEGVLGSVTLEGEVRVPGRRRRRRKVADKAVSSLQLTPKIVPGNFVWFPFSYPLGPEDSTF